MKHYKVVHVQRQNYPVAYLSYDTKTQQFSLRIVRMLNSRLCQE